MSQVILHDAEVDRTTDGCGTVWDLTLAEVKALRVVRTIPNAGRDTQASHTTAEMTMVIPNSMRVGMEKNSVPCQ